MNRREIVVSVSYAFLNPVIRKSFPDLGETHFAKGLEVALRLHNARAVQLVTPIVADGRSTVSARVLVEDACR